MPAPARAAVDLRVCGAVTVYVPATALTAGVLTVGGVPLVVAAGTHLSTKVAVGANLCLALDLDLSGRITDATVTANVTSTLTLCGVVVAYARADADTTGRLTIGGHTLTLAVGSVLPVSVKLGANLCLSLKLNGFGQIRSGTARVNATSTLQLCGTVTAYTRATGTAVGSITAGGRTLVLAAGSRLPASVVIGARLCLSLTLNVLGQVQDGTAKADVQSALDVCGEVTARVDTTNTSNGSLAIAGTRLAVRAGTDLSEQVRVGAFVRLRLSVDVFGRIADAKLLKVGTSLADACQAEAQPSANASSAPGASAAESPSLSPAAVPTFSVLPGIVTNPNAPNDGDATGRPAGDQEAQGNGGIVPDTASLARTASVIALSAVPFLVMLAAIAISLARRRHVATGDRGRGA
jgi:hypothetical protein